MTLIVGMNKIWKKNIDDFLALTVRHGVRMLMVGGGAVNFHGYQRHSADVDFWIDTEEKNLEKLLAAFKEMGYEIDDFPISVREQNQNISIKFSPDDLDVELITRFDVGKSFDEAYRDSREITIDGLKILKYHVLSLEDLITSKVKAGRPKDLLDILELKRIHEL